MKILTKKKQKEILDLLIKSGIAVATDIKVPHKAYHEVEEANYDIANLVGGYKGVAQYYNAVDIAIQREIGE